MRRQERVRETLRAKRVTEREKKDRLESRWRERLEAIDREYSQPTKERWEFIRMFAIMPMETEGHGREFGRRQKMRAKCTVEFVCKYCQRRFTKPYNLMIHERSHKDDVTFSCEVCGKSFKRQDNLKQHRYCQPLSR